MLSIIAKILLYFVSFPARIKGVKFGKNSYISPGYYYLFTKLNGVILGNNVFIASRARIQTHNVLLNKIITIDDGTFVGPDVTISAVKRISIGKKCLLSYNVSILDHEHDVYNPKIPPNDGKLINILPIRIEDECFIGAHSFILKGVHLGKHCVVGANTVVTKSFPAYSVIAGNPGKLLRALK